MPFGSNRSSSTKTGLQDGECITAIAQQPKLAATKDAFALWCVGSDRIATWGSHGCGGDSTAVQNQLKNVRQIHATWEAFAAILADGSVVTWGHPDCGGDSIAVQNQLRDVRQICATCFAFAAILAHGNVVTWGKAQSGGDCTVVQDQLNSVQQIYATYNMFFCCTLGK